MLITSNADISGITIFNHAFLYNAFADDSTFFLDGFLSFKNLIDTLKVFSLFSGLKANFNKCEIAGLCSLKGASEAVCRLKSINLTAHNIKILGVHFSCNDTLKVQSNFLDTLIEEIQKIQKTFKWHSSGPKISHKTPCNNNLENGGLKHNDISSKIIFILWWRISWMETIFLSPYKKLLRKAI